MGNLKHGQKHDAKGRTLTPATTRFARLDYGLLTSAAYCGLSPNARALLVELAMMFDGKNNGTLFLSVRDAAARMGVSDARTAGAAFDELAEAGFIAMTADAHFAVKAGDGSRARTWRLTWEPVGGKMGPTHEYQTTEPAPKTRARKRMIGRQKALKEWTRGLSREKSAVGDFATHTAERVAKSTTTTVADHGQPVVCVAENATHFAGNGGNQPISVVGDFATHTAIPSGIGLPASVPKTVDPPLVGGPKPTARQALGLGEAGDTRDCQRCGTGFVLDRADRAYPRRFCSTTCRKGDERDRERNKRRADAGKPPTDSFAHLKRGAA